MKGNDILLLIKQQGFEQGVTRVLLRLAEEIEDCNKTVKECASVITDLVRVQTMLNGVADGMKARLDKMDDDPRSTQEIVRD